MPFIPIVLLLVLYTAPTMFFWSMLSRLAVAAIMVAFLVSLVSHLWVDSIFQSDNLSEPRSLQDVVRDMQYSLAATLLTSSPYLSGALAAIWLSEGRLHLGLGSLLVAGILAVAQLRISLLPVRSHQPETDQ